MNMNLEAGAEGEVLEQVESDEAVHGVQIVTFSLNGVKFAVPMAAVQEIVRVPETVRVPLASSYLSGLANLRGRVLPIFQSRSMMGMPAVDADEASRVLVLSLSSPVGMVVDHVHSVMNVSEDQLDSMNPEEHLEYTEWISTMVRHESGLILVLDVHKLISAHTQHQGDSTTRALQDSAHLVEEAVDEESNDEWQLVSFEVEGQEYAAPIERVQEIVQVPESITVVPHARFGVLGVMVLRARLLPLLSLRSLFGLPAMEVQEHHRVVVLQIGNNMSVGVVMDRVNEVLRVPRSVVEPLPGLFENQQSVRHIQAMCRLEEGKRLVSVLEVNSLVEHASSALNHAGDLENEMNLKRNQELSEDTELEDEGQVVVFRLGGEEFGVDIHSVQEIVRVPETLTRIPKSPAFLEGVINLRGSVLPVVDQRVRMGIEPCERSDRQRIMVYLMNGVRTGFIVDAVTEVLRLDSRQIAETPKDGMHSVDLIPRVANLPDCKRMILLIDPKSLLSGQEIQEMTAAPGQSLSAEATDMIQPTVNSMNIPQQSGSALELEPGLL